MKTLLGSFCLVFATVLYGQLPVTSGTANTNPFLNSSTGNGNDDLRKAIVRYPYTWEPASGGQSVITFHPNGTANQTNFQVKWRVINPHEVDIFPMGGSTAPDARKVHIVFSHDYSTYAGIDFDGVTPLRGHQVIPPPAENTGVATSIATPRPFFAPPEKSMDDLKRAITGHPYTWEPGSGGLSYIVFKSNGTGTQTHFPVTWKAKNGHEIEVSGASGSPIKVQMKFSDDYSTYTGTDFDGTTSLKGHAVDPATGK